MITDLPLTKEEEVHVTFDMWHATCDMWHMTKFTWWGGWTISENVRSLALRVLEWRCFKYIWTQWSLTHLMNYKGVFRTAPASSDLLKVYINNCAIGQKLFQWKGDTCTADLEKSFTISLSSFFMEQISPSAGIQVPTICDEILN